MSNQKEKTLHNFNPEGARKNVPDIQVYGDPGQWVCLSKASSKLEGWMKSTKAMHVEGAGVIVQVTTQQRNSDGSHAVAEALTFVPGCVIDNTSEFLYLRHGGAVRQTYEDGVK